MSQLAYDLHQAAALCGVSRDLIVKAINAGDLKAKAAGMRKTGKQKGTPSKRVILDADLRHWLEELKDA